VLAVNIDGWCRDPAPDLDYLLLKPETGASDQ
jgi:hypothetical protein